MPHTTRQKLADPGAAPARRPCRLTLAVSVHHADAHQVAGMDLSREKVAKEASELLPQSWDGPEDAGEALGTRIPPDPHRRLQAGGSRRTEGLTASCRGRHPWAAAGPGTPGDTAHSGFHNCKGVVFPETFRSKDIVLRPWAAISISVENS